jgi:thiamine biosynthesis lipoprotein
VPLAAALAGCAEPASQEGQWTALGHPARAEVWASTERAARELVDAFPEAMERVEAIMSRARPDAELARLNGAAVAGYYRVADRDLFRAVALAVDYGRASDGCYDPTIGPVRDLREAAAPGEPDPAALAAALAAVGWERVVLERGMFAVRFRRPDMQLDLDGLVEGYALDVAARKFARVGSLAGLLRLGPHAYVRGRPPHEESWVVPIADPRRAGAPPLVRLRIGSGRGIGVSAAGGTRDPVLDPRTGRPAASDVQVAVAIADSAADAIAVSRALLVGGTSRAGVMLGERTRRVEALLFVDEHGRPRWLASASLRGRIEPGVGSEGGTTDPRFLLPPSESPTRAE